MHKWDLVPSSNCRCGAEEQTADHILVSCPLYHPPNGTLGLAASGVARVPCALGQGVILLPLSTKTTEFEVKNRCKSAEEEKTEHLL